MGLERDSTGWTADAIRTVIAPEYAGTSGARVLAGVLLHCYNPVNYPLDITDLCILDHQLRAMAWGVLRLRVEGGIEPHLVIDGFDQVIDIYGKPQS